MSFFQKKKKRKWWEDEETYFRKFKKSKWSEEDSAYNYSFDSQLTPSKKIDTYQEYKKTGVWRTPDYYKTLVDYRYIEQMANAFSNKYDVRVEVSNRWASFPVDKKLAYDPISLMKYPKARIIALLLHEIGHILHTINPNPNESNYLRLYGQQAEDILYSFEDFRIDKIMSQSYAGAGEIYDSNKPFAIEAVKKNEDRKSAMANDMFASLYGIMSAKAIMTPGKQTEIFNDVNRMMNEGTLFDYLSGITLLAYGEEYPVPVKIAEMIEKTKNVIKESQKLSSTKDVLSILDSKVYPIIEELLKQSKKGNKEMQDKYGAGVMELVMEGAKQRMESRKSYDERYSKIQRAPDAQAGRNNLPKEWLDGDYDSLKNSVESAIKELIKKLTFLRREETTIKHTPNQKRGKINTKSLYRHKTDNFRIFKKKLETRDTIRSFAFSLVLDTSGSMKDSNKIHHSVRALILLAEVFDKMKIPYDISTFYDYFKVNKKFKDKLNNKMKREIGGIIKEVGGGTDFESVFENKPAILDRPEINKIMVIISDGEFNHATEYYHKRYMDELVKDGIKFFGVAINCGDQVVRCCYNNGFTTHTPTEIPQSFSDMLKKLLLKKVDK